MAAIFLITVIYTSASMFTENRKDLVNISGLMDQFTQDHFLMV